MINRSTGYDVIIAGAGPAGSSAAIHLANTGLRVLLLEQKKFPRQKLCGEFISPECVQHFENLGVADQMKLSKPAEVSQTVFYSTQGKRIVVPSEWFGGTAAMGLSRAVMDDVLLKRAIAVGVDVREDATVVDLMENDFGVYGIKFKANGVEHEQLGWIVVDATGRGRVLTRKLRTAKPRRPNRSKLVAFKAHLTNTRSERYCCEIYSYPGGYGGLSTIEDGLSNLCFIVNAADVIKALSNPEKVLQEFVMQNQRARYTLETAKVESTWLSVSLDSFGRHSPSPAYGLLAVGDAASFIDPFTGSGILMALENGKLVSDVIFRHLAKSTSELCADYVREYRRKFHARLRLSGLLRRVAFNPRLAELTINACGSSDLFRNWLARSTRSRGATPHRQLIQPK